MSFRQRLSDLFHSRWLVLVNILLAGAAVLANHYFQFFCRPVTWASVALILSFPPVLFFNLYRERIQKVRGLVSFLFGCAACICLYCILFIWEWNIWALPVTLIRPVAILAYVPHFFLMQIIVILISRRRLLHLTYFKVALVTGVLVTVDLAAWFNSNVRSVSYALRCTPEASSSIMPSYMTERMLGMHWKYHMSFCAYDGWRPPLHDPALVVAAWMNILVAPLLDEKDYVVPCKNVPWNDFVPVHKYDGHGNEKAIIVYKQVFPGRPIREDCSCAAEESSTYQNDPLWRRHISRER